MKYFVISTSEDGVNIETVSDEELLRRLQPEENYYGGGARFLDAMPKEHRWHEYGANRVLIIRGDVVVPKAVEVVKRYELTEALK